MNQKETIEMLKFSLAPFRAGREFDRTWYKNKEELRKAIASGIEPPQNREYVPGIFQALRVAIARILFRIAFRLEG